MHPLVALAIVQYKALTPPQSMRTQTADKILAIWRGFFITFFITMHNKTLPKASPHLSDSLTIGTFKMNQQCNVYALVREEAVMSSSKKLDRTMYTHYAKGVKVR